MDLGLQRDFMWSFVIADVTTSILGINFLEHFSLLIDVRNQKLIKLHLKLSVQGSSSDGVSRVKTQIGRSTPFLSHHYEVPAGVKFRNE